MEKKLTKKEKAKIIKEQAAKYGAEFISYLEDGESAAIFIVRDIVKSIDTRGKWVDILDKVGEKNSDGRWDFTKIKAEIFPRKTNPQYELYPENATDEEKFKIDLENHYLTWSTAQSDISMLCANGYVDPKFEIRPKLVDENLGKFTEIPHKQIWNTYLKQWLPIEWRTPYCDENKIMEIKIKEPLKPKWEYHILSIKRL